MGTNYYVRGYPRDDDMSPDWHLGKKSSAGPFCWDCGVTLCRDGNAGIHTNGAERWYQNCPKCGKKPKKEKMDESSGGRELGFNKSPYKKKTGVASCSSFSWAMDPKKILEESIVIGNKGKCPCCDQRLPHPEKVIENEYGDLFTLEEFKQILEECPVQYRETIGQHFS